MALIQSNQIAIAFKKLSGKAHTQQGFAVTEEGISSNVQESYATIFATPIESLPVTNSGLTTLYSTNGKVQRIKFQIDIIPNTQIGINQSQGYRLKLPADWNTHPGALYPAFTAGTYLHTALGKLQIVPSLYGKLKSDGSTEYDPILYQTNGSTVITKFDTINWLLDPYSGVLFVEDPPAGFDISSNRPGYLEAFLYVGDYLNDVIFRVSTGSTGTTIVNVGNGVGLFKDKVILTGGTSEFRFKSLLGINGISIISGASTVAISFSGNTTGLTYTASNGLTKVGNDFRLGGTLTASTQITSDANEFNIRGTTGTIELRNTGAGFINIETNNGAIQISDAGVNGNVTIDASNTKGQVLLTGNNSIAIFGSGSTGIQTFGGAGKIGFLGDFYIEDQRALFSGIKYAADYSSRFAPRSLVDKGYVTGLTNSLGVSANNGLTKSGSNIHLGGTLTGSTKVSMGINTLAFTGSSSAAKTNFSNVDSKFGYQISGTTLFSIGNNDVTNLQIGQSSSSNGSGAIAIGTSSSSIQNSSIAIGNVAIATGLTSIAIGNHTNAYTQDSVTIGNTVTNKSLGGIFIGGFNNSHATGTHGDFAVSIGAAANSIGGQNIGVRTVTVGSSSSAQGDYSVVVGSSVGFNATSFGQKYVLIGYNAHGISSRIGDSAVAIGQSTIVTGASSIAIGSTASAFADGTIAFGSASQVFTQNAVAIGTGSFGKGTGAIAIGNGAGTSTGTANDFSISIGVQNNAISAQNKGLRSVAIGSSSSGQGDYSVVIGDSSGRANYSSVGQRYIMIGNNINQSNGNPVGTDSIGIGFNTYTFAQTSIAIGANSQSLATQAIAFGDTAIATGSSSIAIGNTALAKGQFSVAMGLSAGSTTGADGGAAVSIGRLANQGTAPIGFASIAIGDIAQSQSSGSIAIGVQAGQTSGSVGQSFVAIGNAANGGGTSNPIGQNSVAIGINSLTKGSSSIAIGNAAGNTSNTDNGTAISIGAAANGGSSQIGASSIAIGASAKSTAAASTAVGNSTTASGNSATAIGNSSIAGGLDSTAIGVVTKTTAQGAIAMGYGINVGSEMINGVQDSFALGWNTQTPDYQLTKATVSTGNAAQTTLLAYALATGTTYSVRAVVTARESISGSSRAMFVVKALAYRESGGAVIEGTTPYQVEKVQSTGASTWDATATVSGNNLNIAVTGAASTTIHWKIILETTNVH
jgi:hypothetical protein